MHECALKYGEQSFQFKILGQPQFVVFTSPASVKHILADNFENYEKGDLFRDKFTEMLGDGIFNVDGSKWYSHRKIASNIFKRVELEGFMTKVFVEHGRVLCSMLDRYASSGEEFDLQDLFYRYTLDTIAQIAFGVELGCLEKGATEFSAAFDGAQRIAQERMLTPLWPIRKRLWFLFPDEHQLRSSVHFLDKYAREVIAERRKDKDLATREDLLSLFMTRNNLDTNEPFVR